jgi:HEAT repeat protein
MKTIRTITYAALVVGLTGSVASADPSHPCHEFSLEGECSEGTQTPTQEAMLNAIRSGAHSRLLATLEYGERVACHACVPLLERRLLEDDNAEVREFAAWWLRRRPFAIGAIMSRMRDVLDGDADPVRRARAAEAIGEFLDPNGLSPLRNAASSDGDAVVREAAVRALGRLNHPDGNRVLADAFTGDADADVRRSAIDQAIRVNFFREHDALVTALADTDAGVRQRASYLVGTFGVGASVPALAALLRGDDDPMVRQAAAWALGRIGTGEAGAALREASGTETNRRVLDAIEIAEQM